MVLRWIEQIARVVRRMLLGPGPPDLAAARVHVEDAMLQLLGPLALLVPRLEVTSAAQLLHDPERILGLAVLLELEATIVEAEGDAAAATPIRERAAAFRRAALACPQCGALYPDAADSCEQRFQQLLALDHSRPEPWGRLHGVVFACYTLQHPEGQTHEALERCWLALYRIVVSGDDPVRLFAGLRNAPKRAGAEWGIPALPAPPPPGGPYSVTLADFGEFPPESHAARVAAWAQATYERWAEGSPGSSGRG
ncbi:MAG TPA: DUF5946 family protein [Gemmatimonadales bacterium]|nr:DUF5946 family protein [Gemmatimonadales bacterium]